MSTWALENQPPKVHHCVVPRSYGYDPTGENAVPCGATALIYCLEIQDYVCGYCHRQSKCLCGGTDE